MFYPDETSFEGYECNNMTKSTSSISKLETALRIHNAKNIISLIYNIYKKSIIILIMYKNREYYAIHILYIYIYDFFFKWKNIYDYKISK